MARAVVMDEASAFPASAASEKRPKACRKFPIFDCPGLLSPILDCPGLRFRPPVHAGLGAKVIERLSRDLRTAFPEMKGFSRANLLYMRAFAEAWPDAAIVQQAVGQLPLQTNLPSIAEIEAELANEPLPGDGEAEADRA